MDEHSCPMLKAALGYAQMGFAVFPCAPRGKTPLVKRGFKAATRDEAQIHEWWTRWPDSNIGIATGTASGLLVVDIDSLDGAKHLGELAEQFGKLPRTARVVTGKGYHLYFCLPARACLQLRGERMGIGRGTLCVSDTRGIPESVNI
jgi:hypothetical protein